jgi:ABC-type transport system involved in cytochrome c biogenesis permease subunit
MRERDGLDYALLVVVGILAAVHIPPYAVAKRETIELAHETGLVALAELLFDIRVAVVLLAVLGLFILLVVTDTIPTRK